jgi:ribulose-phosphate 3-epimerase
MGIKTIGKQGQKLAEETFKILKDIKANQTINKIKIQIDGGCSSQNIENIIQAGADGVVFGSQIFKGQVKDNLNITLVY